MKTLKTDANTTVKDLSEFFNAADKADRIRAKKENGTTVLYIRNRSLLDVLKETFITEHRQQARNHVELAKTTIQTILNKSDRGDNLDLVHIHASQYLQSHQEIQAAEIRNTINSLDTSKGEFKAKRDNVQHAWHTCLDEFVFTNRLSEGEGIKRLQSIGDISPNDRQALTELIRHTFPHYPLALIHHNINKLTYFMKIQGTTPTAGGVYYHDILEFSELAHNAISNATKNKSQNDAHLKLFDVEPLKSAKLFFSALCDPKITPLKIEISDPQKTTFGQRWDETLNDYMNKSPSLSKADALKTIALQNLEDRQNLPGQTIKIFLPKGVSENEMRTAFIEAQCEFRKIG